MKKLVLILVLAVFGKITHVNAQTVLTAGDIAIIGYSADTSPIDRYFDFVLLTDIESGTTINFTDAGFFSGNFILTSEGMVRFTSDTALPAGTIINWTNTTLDTRFTNDPDNEFSGAFTLAGGGDSLIIYQGMATSPTSIFALNNTDNETTDTQFGAVGMSSNDTELPTGLIIGTNALGTNASVANGGKHQDNIAYTATTVSGTKEELLVAIADIDNWTFDNAQTTITPLIKTSITVITDTENPRVQSIGRQTPSTSPTNADVVSFAITFTEEVVNVSTDDFSLAGTSATVSAVSDLGSNIWELTVSGGDIANLNGNIILGFRNSQNIADVAGNPLTNTNAINQPPENSFLIDNIAPSGYSISIDQSLINLSNETSISYTFSAAETDATYNYTYSSDGGGTNVTGSGNVFFAEQTISGIDLSGLSDGTITLSVTLTDEAGNEGSTTTDTITKDTDQPIATISSSESSPTGANPIPITITFSENVTGFESMDMIVTNGILGNFSGSGTTYTFDITPTAPGVINIDIAADIATDAFGNGNSASAQFSITYEDSLGVQDQLLQQAVTTFPNPVSEILTIATNMEVELQKAEIFDISGKLVHTQILNTDRPTNTMNISKLESGIYIITISSQSGNIIKQIIKQ